MDRFQEMLVFIRIIERGSFTRAAEDLQIPRATVTNLMQRMEERLGTRLLERTTRSVRATHDGEAFYRRCVRLVADMEEAEGSFRNVAPKGLLRVNVQGTLAKHFVMPALPEFIATYPGIELHIGEDDRLVDLVREGIDCVLRAGTLQDSSMVGRRIASMEQLTVASPAYLAQFGEPASLEALQDHRAVNYISSSSGKALPMQFIANGEVIEMQLAATVSVTGADLYTGAAVAGLGIVQVPRYRVARELSAGILQVLLGDMPPPPMPVSVLYPHNRQLSSRVRVFAQWLGTIFEAVG